MGDAIPVSQAPTRQTATRMVAADAAGQLRLLADTDSRECARRLAELRRQGYTLAALAAAVGRSTSGIAKMIHAVDRDLVALTVVPASITADLRALAVSDRRQLGSMVRHLWREGYTVAALAAALGVDETDVADRYLEKRPGRRVTRPRRKVTPVSEAAWTGVEPWHGTVAGYAQHGCRCDACAQAQADYVSARRAAVRAGTVEVKHGASGYHAGCRCEVCRAADAARQRGQKVRHRHDATTYRQGDRHPKAVAAHVAQSRRYRRRLAAAQFGTAASAGFLRSLRAGMRLDAVCAEVGFTLGSVYGRMRSDSRWRAKVEAALLEGRVPALEHGKMKAYAAGCRCAPCREAKARERGRRKPSRA